MPGPQFIDGKPAFDVLKKPLVYADGCSLCDSWLNCLRHLPFKLVSPGADFLTFLNPGTLTKVRTGGVDDTSDAGDIIDIRTFAANEQAWYTCTEFGGALCGWGATELVNEAGGGGLAFYGTFILEPVATVDDAGADCVGGSPDGELTHVAEYVHLIRLVAEREFCQQDVDGGSPPCTDAGAAPRPLRLSLVIDCTDGQLTFRLYLHTEQHGWSINEGAPDGVYAEHCANNSFGEVKQCWLWLESAPLDLATMTPEDLASIALSEPAVITAGHSTDCGNELYGNDPVAFLSLAAGTCDFIPNCQVCEPDADRATPLVPAVVDFTDVTGGVGCVRTLVAVIPECLGEPGVDYEVIWSNGDTGSTITITLTPVDDGDPGECSETVTMVVLDTRGCIYRASHTLSGACPCPPIADFTITPLDTDGNNCSLRLEDTSTPCNPGEEDEGPPIVEGEWFYEIECELGGGESAEGDIEPVITENMDGTIDIDFNDCSIGSDPECDGCDDIDCEDCNPSDLGPCIRCQCGARTIRITRVVRDATGCTASKTLTHTCGCAVDGSPGQVGSNATVDTEELCRLEVDFSLTDEDCVGGFCAVFASTLEELGECLTEEQFNARAGCCPDEFGICRVSFDFPGPCEELGDTCVYFRIYRESNRCCVGDVFCAYIWAADGGSNCCED